MTPEDQILEQLAAAGEELAAADAARAAALGKVAAALEAGDGIVPIKTMAERAGVSRVTVYRLLGRPQPSVRNKGWQRQETPAARPPMPWPQGRRERRGSV